MLNALISMTDVAAYVLLGVIGAGAMVVAIVGAVVLGSR